MTRHIIHTPAGDLEQSLQFYKKLDYRIIRKDPPPLVTDGQAIIEINPDPYARAGLCCYKDNLAVIRKIREAGIPITQEITAFNTEGITDNVILSDPGGYGFFVFND